MRRLTIRFILALLTFVVGLTAAAVWRTYRHASPRTPPPGETLSEYGREELAAQRLIRQRIGFKAGAIGCGVTKGGGPYSSTAYVSSDGVRLNSTWGVYGSPEKADEVLRGALKDAIRIVERKPELGDRGQQVGERVVAIIADEREEADRRQGRAAILMTRGSEFSSLDSPSLPHALAFEEARASARHLIR